MGKRLWGAILFVVAAALGAQAQYFAVNGACTLGGQATMTQGIASSGTKPLRGGTTLNGTGVMASYPGCTVTVFQTGTNTPAQIFSTASGGAQSNPFTANLTDGTWVFFASGACYDVTISSGATQASTMPNSKTFPGVCAGAGGTGGGGGGTAGTSVTVNGTAAVPNSLNFTNTLLVPGGSSVVNFLLNGNTVGAYVTGGGGGGGSLPTTPQYDLFASSGAGAAQVSGVKGGSGFLQTQVLTATGDVTSSPSPFPSLPNASVEYFPSGAVFGGITVGAANGLAAYFSHSPSTGAAPGYHNGGIMLGGGNSSGTNYQVYVDCESSPALSCDFKVPVTQNGSAIGGGGGGTPLPTIPQWNLFASTGVATATDSGVAAETGFLRAQVIEASGAVGGAPSGFTPPNGSIEYFPTGATYGGLNVGTLNGIAIHFSHSSKTTGAPGNGGVALAGGNATGTASTYQIYMDCEQVGCDFKVPVTYLGNGIGGGGGTITGATTGGGLVVSGTTLGMLATCTANQYLSWSGSAWICTTLPASGGSGTVSSGTGGFFTWYPATGTTVNSNAHLDDSITTATTITSQETIAAPGINVTGSGGIAMTGAGGTLPAPASGQGGIGIGPGNVPQFYSNGGAWTNIGSGTGGGGVTSINTVAGAFTFSGSGVSCASTTCTFTGGTASVPNPILTTAGASMPAPTTSQGSIGIATNGVPVISINGGAYLPIATNYANGGSSTPPSASAQTPTCAAQPANTVYNMPVNILAGDTVIVGVQWFELVASPSFGGITDSGGSTYTLVRDTYINTNGTHSLIYASTVGGAHASTTLTFHGTTPYPYTACAATYKNVTALGSNNGVGGGGVTTGTVTLSASQAGNLVVGMISSNSAATSVSVTSPGILLASATTGSTATGFGAMCQNTATAAGTIGCTFTWSSSGAFNAGLVELVGGATSPFTSYCPITTDIPFSATAGLLCHQTLPAVAKAWIIRCAIPWNFTSGSGTGVVTVNVNQAQFTGPGTGMYWNTVLWGNPNPVHGVVQQTAAGATTLVTTTALSLTDGFIYNLYLDGVAAMPSAGGDFSISFSTSAGTGAIRSGAYCTVQ